ncbi:MAG: bifunctional N(6)-L-threonylcarbamoyladenine synthase/serine/threonine protein kinase [Candidatus Heimdallarchaeota archaeon]
MSNDPIILGLEGTAHTLGAGIVQGKTILADERAQYVPLVGGIHPRESAVHMAKSLKQVLDQTFEKAKIKPNELDAVAFSIGPGLGACLRTVATAARALSLLLECPLIGVNHCMAHVELGKVLTNAKDPLTIYVSGGNTQIITYDSGRYRVIGETLDIAVGNAFDTFAREIGLSHPGGPQIEKMAKQSKLEKLIGLPYTVKGMSLSFSGLVTAVTRLASDPGKKYSLEDICYAFQEVAFSMLSEVTERALVCTNKKEIVLTGGVAANKRLKEMLEIIAQEHEGVKLLTIPPRLALDNGVMIAWTGVLMYRSGQTLTIAESFIQPRQRVEDIPAVWVSF